MYRISRDHADTAIDPSQQVVFYDAGLCTDVGTTALNAPVRFVQRLLGSVTGAGIKRNIADYYEFIINHYQPGDRIFLFGFSRGAYTVRSLANLLMLCGAPTKTPSGPVMRFRKAARDIAWEAVDTVLEHGAGHPRAEFEDERVELARRFQVKYGSGDGSDSNVAPYFIGVFDTVAALGAKGMRCLVIQAGLSAGVSLSAFIGGFLPALAIATLSTWIFGTGFMIVGFLVQLAIVAAANGLFWYWQNKTTTKTITDYPVPGQSRSHQAIWKGENFDRLLSRHVTFARAAIDETRKDFDRRLGRRRRWGTTFSWPYSAGAALVCRQSFGRRWILPRAGIPPFRRCVALDVRGGDFGSGRIEDGPDFRRRQEAAEHRR
jgi:hypothetical protein